MTNRLIGFILIVACVGCLYWGYTTYMDETEVARSLDDFAQSSGISQSHRGRGHKARNTQQHQIRTGWCYAHWYCRIGTHR